MITLHKKIKTLEVRKKTVYVSMRLIGKIVGRK